ncbi:MAG TPA: hypothetical protein VFM52_07335, partial [Rhodanobacter sp.]|nr:hypothetical protein [Rhodanobacter sp.]
MALSSSAANGACRWSVAKRIGSRQRARLRRVRDRRLGEHFPWRHGRRPQYVGPPSAWQTWCG